ncbi:MAG: hypothetical protein Q8941_15915 [Bacteroidota bacterium]|nr:hypothetical protein [Bacteroidota bacterium]
MKRILQIAAFAFLVTLGSSWRNNASAQGNGDISYQTFYDELSPYGQWIDYPEYGYVWVPAEGPDFRPYSTGGHWVWSDEYDWIWVSDYSWGWAPFHYGRWFYDPFYGWMWMPGYEWAPAWVAWRDGGDYYGWAPLRPGFDFGINISIGAYNPPVDYWCFAERRYICSPRIYDYCLDRGRNVTIINNTTIINNYNRRNNVFVTGPRREEAERYAGRINPVRFREASNPGGARFRNNEVAVYRPRVNQNNNRQFEPRSFERYDRSRRADNAIGRDRGNDNPRNGNNLPVRGNSNDNSRFDRGNNNNGNDRRNGFDQRNDQPANNERRSFDQRGNNPAQQQPGNDRGNGFDRRNDQPANNERRSFDQRGNNPAQQQPANDNRRFDRGNGFDRRNDQPANNERRAFEPGNNNNNGVQQQQQNNNRGFDRGNGFDRGRNNNPAPRQMERPQPSQPQPRQFDNRGGDNGNHEQRGGGGNNNERGRGRRG